LGCSVAVWWLSGCIIAILLLGAGIAKHGH
jgi:hypothetical protein